MCFGQSFELDDPELVRFLQILKEISETLGNGLVADFIPIFCHIPTKALRDARRLWAEWLQLIQAKIDQHKQKSIEDNADMGSLVDDIMKIQHEAILAGEDQADKFTDVNFRQTVSDMFGAGLNTTVATIEWIIAYMVSYPDVQSRVQQEIDDVVGQDHLPLLCHRAKLPYCEAVIHEIMRLSSIVPFAMPHSTTVDTSVGGYDIPKDTWIWCNFWNVHHSAKYWDNPDEFHPERFLDKDGSPLPKPECFLPFSAGRRVCVGNDVAKNELFLIFTGLFQQFTLKVPPGKQKPSLEPQSLGLTIQCIKHEVVAIPRNT